MPAIVILFAGMARSYMTAIRFSASAICVHGCKFVHQSVAVRTAFLPHPQSRIITFSLSCSGFSIVIGFLAQVLQSRLQSPDQCRSGTSLNGQRRPLRISAAGRLFICRTDFLLRSFIQGQLFHFKESAT
jgi:hypothetical protein